MSTCPICGLEGIPPEKTECPQCDADLTCFKILDSLPDALPPPKEKKLPANPCVFIKIVGLLVVLSMGGLTGFLLHQFRQVESQLQDQRTELIESMRNIDTRMERLAWEQSKLQERYARLSESIGKAPDEIPEDKKTPPETPYGFIAVVGLLVVLSMGALTGFLLYRFRQVESQLQDQRTELIEFMRSIDARMERLEADSDTTGVK